MSSTTILFCLLIVSATALPASNRITGGTATDIESYPFLAALLRSDTTTGHRITCAGVLVNNRSVLTAAGCVHGDGVARWRVRVGSSTANSGGVVHHTNRIRTHSGFEPATMVNDIAFLRINTVFVWNDGVQAAQIAFSGSSILPNQPAWAAGWGTTVLGGGPQNSLHEVELVIFSQEKCQHNYNQIGKIVTDDMVCAGIDLNFPSLKGQCAGDEGGPLIQNGVVVGIYSWSYFCPHWMFPGVNTRISNYENWIRANRA